MIPMLTSFDALNKDKTLKKAPIPLTDCISCVVTESINGDYELELEYPSNGIHASDIDVRSIIVANANDTSDEQPFIVTNIHGIGNERTLLVHAEHIRWLMNKIIVLPFATNNTTTSLVSSRIKARTIPQSKKDLFTFKAWKNDITYSIDRNAKLGPRTLMNTFMGLDGSILDVIGGEYEFDWFDVNLKERRGKDTGFIIRYGINLIQCEYDVSIEDRFDSFVYFWTNKDNQNRIECFPYLTTDLTEEALQKITIGTSGLEEFTIVDANDYVDSNGNVSIDRVRRAVRAKSKNMWKDLIENVEVDFVNLSDTIEFNDKARMENLSLGDSVKVVHPTIGAVITERVTKTEYDVLMGRYSKLTLGTKKVNLYQAIMEGRYASTNSYRVED